MSDPTLADEDVPLFALKSLANGYTGIARITADGEPVKPWQWERAGDVFVRLADYERLRREVEELTHQRDSAHAEAMALHNGWGAR